MRLVVKLALALGLAGCGVYTVRLDPPPRTLPAEHSLDLTISLGDVRSVVDGRPEPISPATLDIVDADFVRAAKRSGLFRDVLPRGGRTDLYVDTVRELHAAPMTAARTAYLLFAAPAALVVPGFPHAWDYRVTRTIRLRGNVSGTTIPLSGRELAYDERVWGANYWGGLAADPLREAEGDYLVEGVTTVIRSSYPLFRQLEAAARTGDVENAWLVSVQAGQEDGAR